MTPDITPEQFAERLEQITLELENGIQRGLEFARSINPEDAGEFARGFVEKLEKLFQRYLEMANEIGPDQYGGLKGVERAIAMTSVENAIDRGDFGLLEHRLKNNLISCDLERKVAGQVLSGELKRPANRPKSWKTDQRNHALQLLVLDRICDGDQLTYAIDAVAKEGKTSRTTVHNACRGLIWMRDTFSQSDMKDIIMCMADPTHFDDWFNSIFHLPYVFNRLERRSRSEPENAKHAAWLFFLMSVIQHGIREAKNLEASMGSGKSDT